MLSREERLKQNQEALAKRIQSDAAYIRQVEAEREKREKIDQYKAYQQARVEQANRNNQAIQYAREAAREEYQANLPEYREQERERWKAATQAWREAENARKYYDTRSAETNAREKQRRANAMKDYTALQAQRDNYEYKKNVERAPYQYARQVGYDRDEIRALDQKYTSLNQRAATLEYEAQKALKNDIPKIKNVMDTEKKYGTQDSARAIAGMIETGGAFDPKKNYSGAGKESQAQLIAKTVYLSAIGGVPDPTGRLSFNTEYMTDSEKAVILKMAYAGDLDQLYQYANDLIPVLDAREYDAKQQQISQMSKPAQVAYGMTGTIASPLAYAQMGIDTLRGGYTDLNSGAVAATRLAQTARAKSLENASPVGQFMGNVVYSMADNVVSLALGQTGALIWLGLSAAGNEGVNALENGATQKQAFAKATTSGLIETATEKMGIDNLFDIAKKAGSRGVKNMLLDIAKQAGSEGTEEIISEFANAFADAAIMGQESDFNKAVRVYEAENMPHDEALRKATLEFFVKNPAMAGLAGAVSGALFGVGGVTAQQRNQILADRAAGQQITNRENVGGSFEDVVLSEGMKSSDKRIASKAAALDAIRHENRRSEGFQWSKADQQAIGEIYDLLDPDAKARVEREASNRRAEAEAQARQGIETRLDAAEAKADEEQRKQTIAEQEAETDRLVAEAEGIDLDEAATEREPAEQPETRAQSAQTEAEEMDRLAGIAEEATRTGDTSVLERANQTEQTATQTKTAPTDEKTQRRAYKKQVRDILSSHGITDETSVIDIADEMQNVYKAAVETGGNSEKTKAAGRAFFAAAQSSLENDMLTARSEEIAQELSASVPEENRAVRDYLRGKYYWSKGQSVPGYDSILEFNRAHFGGIQLTSNRDAANLRRLDQVQAEFAQMYPGLAGGDMYNDSDILEHFTGLYDSMKGNAGIDAQVQQRMAQETEAIQAEARNSVYALGRIVLEEARNAEQAAQAQPVQQTVQTTQEAQPKQAAPTTSPEEAGRQAANNARKAGLSAEDTLALSNVARQLGVNLEFRKMRIENINGAYNRETNTILLNQNLSTAEMAWTVFAHEITHAAETAGAYEQVRDIAKRHAAQFVAEGQAEEAWSATIDELRRDYAKNGVKLDRRGGEFEAVANIMQEILGSREAMEGVAQYSREDAQALLASINNVLDRTTENDTAVTPESARLVQAQKALAAALSEVRAQNRYKEDFSANDAANAGKVQFSISRETEQQYEDAVKRGDMDTAQRMVDEAAKKAGYTIKAYHGTPNRFNVFLKSKIGSTTDYGWFGRGFYFTTKPDVAEVYAGYLNNSNVIEAYLKVQNPFRFSEYAGAENKGAGEIMEEVLGKKYENSRGEVTEEAKADRSEDFTEWLKANGYDGAEIWSQIMILDSEQAKRADPVTYDDNGSVIPLSDRFNPEEQDIRYSVAGVNMDDVIRRAIERYGLMPAGEQLVDENGNPVTRKNTEVPNKASANTRSRSFYRTAAESNNVALDVKTRALLDQYIPTSNEKNVKAGKGLRERYKTFKEAYTGWQTMIDEGFSGKGSTMAAKIAFGEQLLLEAQKVGDGEAAINILQDLADFGTSAGQAVQAYSILKRLSPEGQLMRYKRKSQNLANRLTGKDGKVTADVDAAVNGSKVIDDLLNRLDELKKLQKKGDQMTEAEARRIADLEAEIEELTEQLGPLLEKFDRLKKERHEDAMEAGKLKRQKKTLPRQIEATQKEIDEIQKVIDELNNELEPKRLELQDKLAEEAKTKEERDKLKKELSDINEKIRNARARINRARATILHTMAQMATRGARLSDMQQYEKTLETTKDILDVYLRYVKRKGGNVVIPTDLQMKFLNAKTEEERDAIQRQMDMVIAEQLPGTWAEKIRAIRYTSMLANYSTHLRNIGGNFFQFAASGISDAFSTAFETMAMRGNMEAYQRASALAAQIQQQIDEEIKKESPDKKLLKELYRQRKEARQQMADNERTHAIVAPKIDRALYNAAHEDYLKIKDDLQAGGKASETEGIEKYRKIFTSWLGSRTLEPIRRWTSAALEKEDAWFLEFNYTKAFAEYLKANNIDPKNASAEQMGRARAVAFENALKNTYRDPSALATKLNEIEKMNGFARFFLAGALPFKKTPINIAKRAVEYSPLGLIRTANDLRTIVFKKETNRTKSEMVGDFCKALTGSALFVIGMLGAGSGWISATPGYDDKERDKKLEEATGRQNYAIKFRNPWTGQEWTYTMDWAVPVAMPLFAGARAREVWEQYHSGKSDEDAWIDSLLEGFVSTLNPLFELTMLDGLTDLLKSYESEGSSVAASLALSVTESFALQFLPTLGGKVARVVDPYQRSTKVQGGKGLVTRELERLYRRAAAKIPGVAQIALEPVTNQDGSLKENIGGNWVGRLGYNLFSPGYAKKVTHFEVDEEMKRLYKEWQSINADKATSVLPKQVPSSVNMDGTTYYLDAREYRLWGERMGKEAYAALNDLYASEKYKSANDVQKGNMVADTWEAAYEHAKIGFFEDIGIADEYYTKGAQSNIEKLLYDDSQGYREYKNIPAVRELYESGVLDPKTVYDAALTLSHIKKDADKLDALNKMKGLNQDEYSFLYMTKIADDNMMADIQATLDAGGDLYKAVSVASQYYKWDESAVDEKTGETGKWVSVDKGTKAGLLADSDLTNSAKEAFYLNKIVSTNNVEKEQAKIAEYYDRGLTINDYLHTLGIKYDDEGTAYENAGGLFRELLASGYSDAVKEAAVCNVIKHTENSSDKAEAQIAIYKAAKLTVNDYLSANAAMYGSDGNALKTVREKAIGLRDSGMSDKAKTVAWYTTVSDAKAAEENIRTFLSGGNTVDQFLTAVSATSVDGMKQYQKAAAIMQMGLKSYTAAMKSVVTGSENAAEAINNSLAHGISDKLVATAYTEYLRINADESTYGNAKAQQFAKWLEEDSRMSTLSRDQRNFMRDNFSYYIQIKASAGTYNNLMSYTGMSSKAADSISTALSSLKPLPGAKGVTAVQKYTAIANDRNSTDNEKDIAMYNMLDTDDDEADSKALKYYKLARSHGVSVAQYADFRTKNATLTADKDKNGKSISGSKREKQLKLINSYPISASAKDDLYRAAGLGESTLKKAPWH